MNFIAVEEYNGCSINLEEIIDNEQQLLKNNRINNGNIMRLPGWSKIIYFFKEMGRAFKNYLK